MLPGFFLIQAESKCFCWGGLLPAVVCIVVRPRAGPLAQPRAQRGRRRHDNGGEALRHRQLRLPTAEAVPSGTARGCLEGDGRGMRSRSHIMQRRCLFRMYVYSIYLYIEFFLICFMYVCMLFDVYFAPCSVVVARIVVRSVATLDRNPARPYVHLPRCPAFEARLRCCVKLYAEWNRFPLAHVIVPGVHRPDRRRRCSPLSKPFLPDPLDLAASVYSPNLTLSPSVLRLTEHAWFSKPRPVRNGRGR